MKDQILEKLLEYLQSTQDFVLKETPQVIQEALRYHYLSNMIGVIICCFALPLIISLFYYVYTHQTLDKYENREILSSMICVICPMVILFLIVALFQYSDNLIKISYAPKYFLIELFMNKGK